MDAFSDLKGYLFDSLGQLVQNLADYLPNLLGAVALLVVGFILAALARWAILRLGAGIDRLVQAVGIVSVHTRLKWPVADILGWVLYWIIVLLFIRASLASLKLPSLAELLGRLLNYLPMLLIGAVVIFAGVIIGNALRDRIVSGARSIGMEQAGLLGTLARFIIIILAVIVGITQIGIDVSLFAHIFTILVAAVVGAVALAFGLGAGPTVSNIISARYVSRNYDVGQDIRINNIQGRILEILPTGVVLETDAGRTFIPAKVFNEEASVLLDDKSLDDD